MTARSRTLNIEYQGNSYQINFPNNRQYLAIHNMRTLLTPSQSTLEDLGAESQFASQLVDMESYFTILAPTLIKDLNMPISNLPLEEGLALVTIYNSTFRPWYLDWLNEIFKANKPVEVESDNK